MLFQKHKVDDFLDLSTALRDLGPFSPSVLRNLGVQGEISALAIEPFTSLLALGTSRGVIHLYGSPSATCEIQVSGAPFRKIKFLSLQCSKKLIAVDSKNNMSVFDLTNPSKPTLHTTCQVSSTVNALVASPSHQHVFLALANGQCMTFDLDRGCTSPYAIPNLWSLYESKSGVFRARGAREEPILIDISIHPRDLNTLLLAYEGGVAVWDITNRNTVRVYELTSSKSTIREADARAVTCISFHPSGMIFAAGHIDGSISFWALGGQETSPSACLALHVLPPANPQDNGLREPIFKLAWSSFPSLEECKSLLSNPKPDTPLEQIPLPILAASTLDYASGETTLTVLGGLSLDDPKGISVLQFPALTLSAPLSSAPPAQQVELARRQQTIACVPIGLHVYAVESDQVDDFLLVPRVNPHFSGSYDPISILLLSKGEPGMAPTLEALEFPPPMTPAPIQPSGNTLPVLESDFAKPEPFNIPHPLFSPTLPRFRLPPSVWTGRDSITMANIQSMNRDSFMPLLRWWLETGVIEDNNGSAKLKRLPLRAGTASVNEEAAGRSGMRLNRFDPHILLTTCHADLSIRFYDLSKQLLHASSPLVFEYPQALPHLTIPVPRIIQDQSLNAVFHNPSSTHIQSYHLSENSLDCLVSLSNGSVIVYRFATTEDRTEDTSADDLADLLATEDGQDIVLSIKDLASWDKDGFKPVCVIDARRGRVSCIAVSDIGLHAIAYNDGSIIIFEARTSRVLWPDQSDSKKASTKSDPVCVLTWSLCSIDGHYALHLLAISNSGATDAVRLTRNTNDGQWVIVQAINHVIKTSVSNPNTVFVIRTKDGKRTDPHPLDGIPSNAGLSPKDEGSEERVDEFFLVGSLREMRCFANVDGGSRLGKAQWNASVVNIELLRHMGATVLLAFTERRECLVYSIPALELINTLRLPEGPSSLGLISTDNEGHFIELHPTLQDNSPAMLIFSTLVSDTRKAPPPLVDYSTPQPSTFPAQPVPLSVEGSYTSWLWGPKVYSGQEIDSTLAGPNRPPLKSPNPNKPSIPPRSAQRQSSLPPPPDSGPGSSDQGGSMVGDLYSRLSKAAAERGEALGGLEESFNNLGNASKDMVAQAKRLAAGNSVKRFFF